MPLQWKLGVLTTGPPGKFLTCRIHWRGAHRASQFYSWVGKIPWRRDRLPTPVSLGFPDSSDRKDSTCNVGDLGSILGLGRFPGGEHGNLLQYSCLENPHGQRSLVGYSPGGHKELDTTERQRTTSRSFFSSRGDGFSLLFVWGFCLFCLWIVNLFQRTDTTILGNENSFLFPTMWLKLPRWLEGTDVILKTSDSLHFMSLSAW